MYNTSDNNRFHLQKKGRKHTCPQCVCPLMNRNLVVWPDSGEYVKWSERMKESGHKHYTVVDILEQYEANTDIADIILRHSPVPEF